MKKENRLFASIPFPNYGSAYTFHLLRQRDIGRAARTKVRVLRGSARQRV